MNLASIIVLLIVIAICALLVVHFVKQHKRKKNGCGSGCTSCPYCNSCHK